MASEGEDAVVQVFFIRSGRLIGRDHFYLKSAENDTEGEILSSFIKQFYAAHHISCGTDAAGRD